MFKKECRVCTSYLQTEVAGMYWLLALSNVQEEAAKRGELEADKDRMMREYRIQLDAEREQKLAQGSNHYRSSRSKSKHRKGMKEDINI